MRGKKQDFLGESFSSSEDHHDGDLQSDMPTLTSARESFREQSRIHLRMAGYCGKAVWDRGSAIPRAGVSRLAWRESEIKVYLTISTFKRSFIFPERYHNPRKARRLVVLPESFAAELSLLLLLL
jgi:hypothetical protein